MPRPPRSLCLLIALVTPLVAAEEAEPLALWAFGTGTRTGQPANVGAVVVAGDGLIAGDQPVRLELIGFPGSDLILRPGSDIHLRRDTAHRDRLVVDLRSGSIEVDLRGSGAAGEVEVRGAALSVRGHDCLLLIERDEAQADYVAVISGQVMAGIRPGLNIDDGGMAILLQARQGLRCSSANGLAEVDQLDERPQLLVAASLQDQGQEAGDGESWSRDEAATATDDPPADGGITSLPLVATAPVPPSPEPFPSAEPAPLAVVPPPAQVPQPEPARPAPPAQAPETSHSRPSAALIDALADDVSPGWQRRGRTVFPSSR